MMLSKKDKVILIVLSILCGIVILLFLLKKFNVIKFTCEPFVDDEEEGYEDDAGESGEDGESDRETFDDTPATTKQPTKTIPLESKETKPTKVDEIVKKEDVKPIDSLSAKLKHVIDQIDKDLKTKNVPEKLKKTIVLDAMGKIESFNDTDFNTVTFVKNLINKHVPQETYVDTPVLSRSIDSIKNHLTAALDELQSMSSQSTKESVKVQSERFTPSRDIPVTPQKKYDEEVIEGFENTPHYALY